MPTRYSLTFDLHGKALALFFQESVHFGFEDIASAVVSGSILGLLLLGVAFWKRNNQAQSQKFLIGSFSLFILKLPVFGYSGHNLIVDIAVTAFILFLVVFPWCRVNNQYQHRALLLCFFGLLIVLPACIFGMGSLPCPSFHEWAKVLSWGLCWSGL